MKIFISWSGTPSHNIAIALKDWLPFLFTGIEPFVSSEGVRKGKRWQIEIAKELETSNYGIVCLTPDNTEAPWILFEAGALSKSLKESSVSTLLTGGLRNGDIEGPLSHFQHTTFEKEDFFKLVISINEAQPNGKQDVTRLQKVFDKFWDELSVSIDKALKTSEKPEKKRSLDDMMRELLDVTNSIAKNMPQQSGMLEEFKKYYGASQITAGAKMFDMGVFWADLLDTLQLSYTSLYDALGGVGASYENGRISLFFPNEGSLKAFKEKEYSSALFPLVMEKAKAHGARINAMSLKMNNS